MKKILFLTILLLSPLSAFAAQTWPAAVGYVNDFARVIPADKAAALELYLRELEAKTGSQVAVVTVQTTEGGDINGAAVDLFKAWGIGKKGQDNGVLILAAIKDRHARIEVGYGLEAVITDGTAGDILRQGLIPQFKMENYGQGLTDAASMVGQLIARNAGVDLDSQAAPGRASSPEDGGAVVKNIIIIILVLLFIIFRIWWFFAFPGVRRFGGGGGLGGFGGGGSGGGGASGSW